jgi:hypothetical protein
MTELTNSNSETSVTTDDFISLRLASIMKYVAMMAKRSPVS